MSEVETITVPDREEGELVNDVMPLHRADQDVNLLQRSGCTDIQVRTFGQASFVHGWHEPSSHRFYLARYADTQVPFKLAGGNEISVRAKKKWALTYLLERHPFAPLEIRSVLGMTEKMRGH